MIKDNKQNSKRIAKNTMLLYFRMAVTTVVSLYTARLLLQLLGVEDYGINNVVSGVVLSLSFINGTMTSATQRFLAFDLGTGDIRKFQNTYSMIINVFILICFIFIILLETAGPWFISNKLIIAENRLDAALLVFQLSLISFLFTTLTIPFQSAVIAYEKMGIYAYFTFIDVIFKLGAVGLLSITSYDKLIVYGIVSTCFSFVVFFINLCYCRFKLPGCYYKLIWDKSVFGQVASYSGWNMFGAVSTMLNQQGQAILLNMFYGPVINTAKAVADKINQTVYTFCGNFYMAVSPQIVKSYASCNIDYTKQLVLRSSKYAYFLLFFLSAPLIMNMIDILTIWLGKESVSNDMVIFCQCILIYSLICVLEPPITFAIRATGHIKNYQIVIGCITLLFIPISYVVFKYGSPAYYSMIVLCVLYIVAHCFRISFVLPIIQSSFKEYLVQVFMPITLLTTISIVVLKFLHMILKTHFWELIILDVLIIIIVLYMCVLNISEKHMILTYLKNLKKKITVI